MNDETKQEVIRISAVDDHPVVLQGIQLIFKNIKQYKIEFINQYSSGSELINNLKFLNSDVLLIDMCLPDIKGYELAHLVLEQYPEIKIGIYSHMLDRESILNSFKMGVLGYLSKSAGIEEIIEFVLTINRGERYVRGIVANIIFESENFFRKQKNFNITKRELEIIQLILDGKKNREIADILSIAERTVEFHKQNIYIKLNVNNSVDLYKTVNKYNLLTTKDIMF
jgi:DNA-binding NarL/FixJ family response regulator